MDDSNLFCLALSLPAISKVIGDEWKKLSEDQKAVSRLFILTLHQQWNDKAKSLKLDYEIEKHQLQTKNAVNGSTSKNGTLVKKSEVSVGNKRSQPEMTQTQKENDCSSVTSFSDDEAAQQQTMLNGNKKQKVTDDSSDL